ncbi:putative calcium-binding protein CML17 [Forsythia ovata]|uniref:Calcium-binding protein CML17 n=1 Tax=Forsythia ovata TaxID=205694 RepID=A0ABD1TAC9_9LAMI
MNINSLLNQEQSLKKIHSHQNGHPRCHPTSIQRRLMTISSNKCCHLFHLPPPLFTWDVSSVFYLSLTQLELGSLLRSLGLKPSSDKLDSLIQKADKYNNGLVEFSEFVALMVPNLLPAKSPYTDEQLRQLFRMFGRDGNRYITAVELAHSMAKLGHA